MRKAFTLVELAVTLAIIATLLALLYPAFDAARRKAAGRVERSEPAETWLLRTVKHDEHLWVMSAGSATVPAVFCHHPDCPCRGRTPEAQ
jgi:prepilin-type N-terminal cleavage/methylation domain-containing protein